MSPYEQRLREQRGLAQPEEPRPEQPLWGDLSYARRRLIGLALLGAIYSEMETKR